MKVTIDTTKKTLFVEEATVKELQDFLSRGEYDEYIIKQERDIQLIPHNNNPMYEIPCSTPFTPNITC